MLELRDRTRIKAEERFRQKISFGFTEKPKTRWRRAWAFLNSGFGLLLVPTVLLGSLSRLYVDWSDSRKDSRERANASKSPFG